MNVNEIQHLVQDELLQTNKLIQAKLASHVPLAQEIAEHIIKSGGKRIRPTLSLLVAKALQYQGEAHIMLAAIVELLHTATLLHDDVIDESQMRRGRPTANANWGNEASVLVGDLLYSRSFSLISELRNFEITELIAHASGQIVEGEVLQLMNCHNPDATEKTYLEIIERKTGQLFAVATQSIAIIMQQPQAIQKALHQYGISLGVAFQMMDDALDYAADPEVTGKNIGDDLAEGKPTLPMLFVLKNGSTEQKAIIKDALLEPKKANITEIQHILISTGAIEYTKQQAKEHAKFAIEQLTVLPNSAARDALVALASIAANRQQ